MILFRAAEKAELALTDHQAILDKPIRRTAPPTENQTPSTEEIHDFREKRGDNTNAAKLGPNDERHVLHHNFNK